MALRSRDPLYRPIIASAPSVDDMDPVVPIASSDTPQPNAIRIPRLSALPKLIGTSENSQHMDRLPQPTQIAPSQPLGADRSVGRIQLDRARSEVGRLQTSGDGISQIKSPILRTLARIGDVAGSALAPGIAAQTPGTSLHHQVLLGRAQGQESDALANLQGDADLEQRRALASQEQARAWQLTHPKPSPGQLLYDKNGSAIGFQDGEGRYYGPDDEGLPEGVRHVLASAQRKQPTNAFELWQSQNPKGTAEDYLKLTGEGKIKTLAEQYNESLKLGDTDTANRILKVIRDTQTQPKIDVHAANERPPRQMVFMDDGQGGQRAVEVTPGMTIPGNASKSPGGPKISSDEQKRADLAQNLNENIDALEEILGRRPELFGPVAGRWTQFRNLTGTDDQDVAQLMAIEHQLGMVAQGAHGMRSAQGVEAAARSLTNGFRNSPAATRAGLEAARKSVQTFFSNSQAPGQARGAIAPQIQVGQKVKLKDGTTITVKAVHPDGSFE